MNINCYISNQDLFVRNVCALAEKCYYNNLRGLILTHSNESSDAIDRALWTYSKQHFIPHAKSSDLHPEIQPILISEQIIWINHPAVIIDINPDMKQLLNLFANIDVDNQKKITKIILMIIENNANMSQIEDLVHKSPIKFESYNKFKQLKNGEWQQL